MRLSILFVVFTLKKYNYESVNATITGFDMNKKMLCA